MSNITVIATSAAHAAATGMGTELTALGHTPTVKAESAITSGSESAQDLLVCIQNSEGNTTLVADLNTHMTTHGVPILLCWQAISGTYSITALACLLGVVVNVRTPAGLGGGPSNGWILTDDHQDEGVTDGFAKATPMDLYTANIAYTALASDVTGFAGTSLL